MKRIITLIIAIILVLGMSVNAVAEETSVTVEEPYEADFVFPDGYTPITKATVEDNSELLSFLGITKDTMYQYFNEKGFLAFSISSDYREQIYIIAEQNDVSSAIGNLSDVADPTSVQSLLLGDIEGEGGIVTVTEPINSNVFYYVIKEAPKAEPAEEGEEPAETETCMVYYATVIDSVAYVVCYSNESGVFTDEAKLMMSGFVNNMKLSRGPDDPTVEEQNNVQIIVNWVLIALASGILIYAAVTVIAEFKKRRLEEDFNDKAPKKPLR